MSSAQTEAVLVPQRLTKAPRLRLVIWSAAVMAIVVPLYGPTVVSLAQQWWTDPDFSQGLFVPFFSAYLVWRARARLRSTELRPSWTGLLIVIVSLLVLLVGRLGSELFLARLSLLGTIAGAILFIAGWSMFREVLFAWAVLLFTIPIPSIVLNQLTLKLQFLASQAATALLSLCGVPVLREGNVIRLAAMPLEVAEACSGIRSLLSLTTLALIYGYFADRRISFRVLLVCAAAPIAIAANALRIFGTGLTVQFWDPEKATGFFHEFSGWVVFMVSAAMMMVLHAVFKLFFREGTSNEA